MKLIVFRIGWAVLTACLCVFAVLANAWSWWTWLGLWWAAGTAIAVGMWLEGRPRPLDQTEGSET